MILGASHTDSYVGLGFRALLWGLGHVFRLRGTWYVAFSSQDQWDIARRLIVERAEVLVEAADIFPMWWFPKNYGYLFGCPYIRDYNIMGSISGSPYLGKPKFKVVYIAFKIGVMLAKICSVHQCPQIEV